MPTTIHPSPNEVVRIAASEEIGKRVSAGAGSNTRVIFAADVSDENAKEVVLSDKNGLSVDVYQPVSVLTNAATLVLEGIEPLKPLDEVAYENFSSDAKVEKAKEPAKKEHEEVASKNEGASIPSFSGADAPPPSDDQAATESKSKAKK